MGGATVAHFGREAGRGKNDVKVVSIDCIVYIQEGEKMAATTGKLYGLVKRDLAQLSPAQRSLRRVTSPQAGNDKAIQSSFRPGCFRGLELG